MDEDKKVEEFSTEEVQTEAKELLNEETLAEEIPEEAPVAEETPEETSEEEPAEEAPEEPAEAEATPEAKGKKGLPLWGAILVAVGAFFVGLAAVLGGWIGARVISGQPALPDALREKLGIAAPTEPTEAPLPGDEAMGAVPVAQCGDHVLTAGAFQVYHRMQYFNFMSQYGAYAEFFGLDLTKPLDEQDSIMEGYTWDAYFRAAAMEQYGQMQAVCQAARAAGFALPADVAQELETLPSALNEDAVGLGYESGPAYIQEVFGTAVTMDDYMDFARSYYLATSYEDSIYDNLTYSDDDLDAYYANNEAELNADGIVKQDSNDVTIRHILIRPEDTDGDGDVTNETEEIWAAAKAEAERILNEYLADPTEENFSNLAAQYSADENAAQGGIYEGVYPGQMVETFNDWCFDPDRQPGDTGIVETQFGYHVMYFVRTESSQHWRLDLGDAYRSVLMQGVIEEAMEAYPVTTLVEEPVIQPIPVETGEAAQEDELLPTEP